MFTVIKLSRGEENHFLPAVFVKIAIITNTKLQKQTD